MELFDVSMSLMVLSIWMIFGGERILSLIRRLLEQKQENIIFIIVKKLYILVSIFS